MKKKGIKKYVTFIVIYAFMIYYCIDEKLPTGLVIACLQLLLVTAAAMIKKEAFPVPQLNQYRSLPKWLLILSLVLIVPFSEADDRDRTKAYHNSRATNTYTWPSKGLSQKLPQPVSDYGQIWEDNDLEFRMDLYNVSEPRFKSYVKACKRIGFDDISYENEDSFSAWNEEGYLLYCWLDKYGELSLTLTSPNQLKTIDWPDNELLQLLPEPENLYGRIDADRSGYAAVCLGSIWETEFKNYVSQCRSAGFNRNYERKSDLYQGEDENGNLLLLDWNEDTNTMYLQIWSKEYIDSQNTVSVSEDETDAAESEDDAAVLEEEELEARSGEDLTESKKKESEEKEAGNRSEKESSEVEEKESQDQSGEDTLESGTKGSRGSD